ncbi:MAG: L,D-transpeptidase, partial [Acidimicrobiales bacterium]
IDARVEASGGFLAVAPAREGRVVDQPAAVEQVSRAGDRLARGLVARRPAPTIVELSLVRHEPAVTAYADAILVRTGENRLYHYENGALVKTYVVATGTARYPTPRGTFTVTLKRRNPTWVNPDPSGWGAGLPARIGPGPRNPLGTRAMNLDAPGIRIHGTTNVASLGTNASHGCIRMAMADAEELFDRVEEGTPVLIIHGPPAPSAGTVQSTFADPAAPIDLEAG